MPTLATRLRLMAFAVAMLAVVLALIAPMHPLSSYFLIARTFENVLLVMIAAPFFWLSAAFHISVWGLPTRFRNRFARTWFRSHRLTARLRSLLQPGLVWFLFLATFLMWHDHTFVEFTMPSPILRILAPLWLFVTGLLFWWQIIGTGPRRYTTGSALVRLGCLLAVEVPNVATGMYIAFHQHSIYDYYEVVRTSNPLYFANSFSMGDDQSFSGALSWVFGSLVYFGSFVLVLNSIWRSVENSSQPQPPVNWDADEKFIMPGLERRLKE